MADYYQVVHSKIREGAEPEMLAIRPRFVTAMRAALPGLLDARLIRLDDGTWLDIVRWESPEAAEAGAAAHATVDAANEMGGLISEVIAILQGHDAEPMPALR